MNPFRIRKVFYLKDILLNINHMKIITVEGIHLGSRLDKFVGLDKSVVE